ncbi:phycobilisome degradation family protein [cyanobacterium TDX16]|nr:phycobilisome degradation family protein [cyanobacterium TDX16]
MDRTIKLTLEQEFSLRNFADQVQRMSREQAQEFLLVQYKHMIIQDMMYQEILKKDWQLERDFSSLKTRNQ